MIKDLKVFAHPFAAGDWGFDHQQLVDYETALQQPFRVAVVPVFFNWPTSHFYWQNPLVSGGDANYIDLSRFDLVLVTSIELIDLNGIYSWLEKLNVKKYCLSVGGISNSLPMLENEIYRPWWAFNIVNNIAWQDISQDSKPFLFDMLLGARRPHRDFAMLAFQKLNLLDSSIVTYRDIFNGHEQDARVSLLFDTLCDQQIQHPYVSANLDAAWEVAEQLHAGISQFVPWEIYRRCYYSVICETTSTSNGFFLSEKTGKAFYAKRMFLHFGSYNFLANLHQLGFETFGDVIDESYDHTADDLSRYCQVVQQLKYLKHQDPQKILEKVKPKLEHNYHQLIKFKNQTRQQMNELVLRNLNGIT